MEKNYADALTVDQMRVLVSIADTGSFSGAARSLQRSQSTVSYQIATLEAQLGLTLFHRTRRRPELTPAGRSILAAARDVLASLEALRARGKALGAGVEARLRLAIDVLYSTPRLARLLLAFESDFPDVEIDLHMGVRDQPGKLLREGAADIAVLPEGDGCEARVCARIELIPVAAPTHPLAERTSPASDRELARHLRLVLSDGVQATDEGGSRRWRLNDSMARHTLLIAGVGWCMMPRHQVADDLREGRLARLSTHRHGERGLELQLFVAHDKTHAPGPASRWWFERL